MEARARLAQDITHAPTELDSLTGSLGQLASQYRPQASASIHVRHESVGNIRRVVKVLRSGSRTGVS